MIAPMLATECPIDGLKASAWAFEGKHDGVRIIARNDSGSWQLQTRSGRVVTDEFKIQFPDLPAVVLDGEAVVLDNGVPSFNAIQNKAVAASTEFYAFDLLELEGTSLANVPYEVRRQLLEALGSKCGLTVPSVLDVKDGAEAMAWAESARYEGVVAKRLDGVYQQGKRSKLWLKSKVWRMADVVLGGWKEGNGRRSGGVGNLMMGIPTAAGLQFCGRVGTGFTDADLDKLGDVLAMIETDVCPFVGIPRSEAKGANWIRPVLCAEVRYQVVTAAGHLRHPSWRGLK